MGSSIIFVLLSFIIHIVMATYEARATFNVTNFGATGDGKTDDSRAFLAAWDSACNNDGIAIIIVPSGKSFLLKPISFLGPCKSLQIQFLLQGIIVAPSCFDEWKNCTKDTWIYFGNVRGLFFTGLGTIDGKGALWWGKPIPRDNVGCQLNRLPTALRFHTCNDLQVKGTTHMNSPWNHIQVEGSNNVEMSRLNIMAPFDSPNTDGIDISSSSNVYIHDSVIATGDDCIAIKKGSYFIKITGVHCGPGHGISIGSLGEYGANEVVEHVLVSNCTLNGTTNGVRIKTWEGGSGHVSDILFQDITLNNSSHPIFIHQNYIGASKLVSNVQVSDVTFRGFQGTSATNEAILLRCSASVPCTKLKFDNINIAPQKIRPLISKCEYAHGIVVPPIVPNITCLLS